VNGLRWWWRRRARVHPAARLALAAVLAAVALVTIAGAPARGQQHEADAGGETTIQDSKPGIQDYGVSRQQLAAEGKVLFGRACSSCHGADLRGIAGRGPSLRGVGEASADFYVRTGRMPLRDPEDQPRRTESPYSERQKDALIAYVASYGGPGLPTVDAAKGNLSDGFRLFSEYCMGCHQVVAQGGITTTGVAPDLQVSAPIDVAEAVQVSPYVMPYFKQLTKSDVDSLAAYVDYTKNPDDVGGWGIGHIGPIPEGMVAWLLAGVALLLTIRVIGERTTE
jgi:ubiquinol-cytochrome c reductase cytochrome c subunit